MKRSIRTRLTVWVLVLLVPLSAGAGWLLIEVFGNRLLHDTDVALEEEAETVAELATTAPSPDAVTKLVAQIGAETDWGPRKFITVTAHGELIAAAPREAWTVLQSVHPLMRVVRYDAPDGSVTVSIGVSVAAALHAKQRLTSLLAIGIPLTLLLLGTSLWLVIGRALRPLEEASQRLDDIGAETLSVRIPVESPDDEVGRMVTVLNRMLARLERAVTELQRFTADAAHELRTPLTVLRTGLEVALSRDRPAEEYRAALGEALASTDRVCRLAEDLLTLARLEAIGAPRASDLVDISEVLHELAAAAEALASQRRIAIAVHAAPGLSVRGDAGDLYRLFNNLIENAVRHSRAAGHVVLAARSGVHSVEITVTDDGLGIPAPDLSRVFDRFYRANGAAQDAAGTGLGLSIALQIARTHGGKITAENAESGGCIVTVTLPAVPC